MTTEKERIIEELADLEHQQWMYWSKNIVNNERISEDRNFTRKGQRVQSNPRQMEVTRIWVPQRQSVDFHREDRRYQYKGYVETRV